MRTCAPSDQLTVGQTRNPDKYTKNADRNRLRAIEKERRTIWCEAIKQAQRLAAVHDQTGAMFNVGPVVVKDDGQVVSVDGQRKREERKAQAALSKSTGAPDQQAITVNVATTLKQDLPEPVPSAEFSNVSQERMSLISSGQPIETARNLSKSQQKRLSALQPRPAPRQPVIPDGISIPETEENWIAMWNLNDDELEKRVLRAKRKAAAGRKALRLKQQAGKVERRTARDEKRKVYRELKLTWKLIKGLIQG